MNFRWLHYQIVDWLTCKTSVRYGLRASQVSKPEYEVATVAKRADVQFTCLYQDNTPVFEAT